MERTGKEPVIDNTYMASKAAASVNLVLSGIFFTASHFINGIFWYKTITSIVLFAIGIFLVQAACGEFRKAAALDRVVKMSNKS